MNQESPEKNQDIEDQDKKNRGTEHQGTKEKFWFGKNQDKLFKIGKHEGENWAEIVACHLATLLDIPCAKYTPGSIQENSKTTYGVISQSFVNKKEGGRLINANEFLTKLIKNYDPDKAYKQRNYTFSQSIALIKLLTPNLKESPIKQFIGYLVFDVWIGNQDRHHENWGFVASSTGLYLAPSFDHASSMGCRVGDIEKQERLNTKDTGYSVEAFSSKAKTAMYNDGKILKTYELSKLCYKHYPNEYCFWTQKINQISKQDIIKCFESLPENWMSDIDKKFTTKLLQANQKQLNKLCVKN